MLVERQCPERMDIILQKAVYVLIQQPIYGAVSPIIKNVWIWELSGGSGSERPITFHNLSQSACFPSPQLWAVLVWKSWILGRNASTREKIKLKWKLRLHLPSRPLVPPNLQTKGEKGDAVLPGWFLLITTGNYVTSISLGTGKTGILSRVLSGSTNKRLLKEDYKTARIECEEETFSFLFAYLPQSPASQQHLFDPEAAIYSRSNGWFQFADFPDY